MMLPRKRGPTIRDVANAADVSTATVSKLMAGRQRFSTEVEERIRKAVQDLGWSTNPMASAIMTGRTGNIGIVVIDLRSPNFNRVLDGVTRAAVAANLNFIVADVAQASAQDLGPIKALARRVDGLIVSARLPAHIIAALFEQETPLVFYGGPSLYADYHSVRCDNFHAGRLLGDHLRDRGFRKISYLGFPTALSNAERWRGLRSAFDSVEVVLEVHEASALIPEEGERLASVCLQQEGLPHAVVSFSDSLALGLLSEARRLGIKVPDQVAVAAFDNTVYGRLQFPSLTSVDLMSEEVGERAMQCLSDVMRGNLFTGDAVLNGKLVVRESTSGGLPPPD